MSYQNANTRPRLVTPSNRVRRARAADIIEEYRDRWDRGEPAEDALCDLVADLMHYCHEHGDKARNERLSWPEIESRAAMHFEAELEEEAIEAAIVSAE